jgi:hypothetical protein
MPEYMDIEQYRALAAVKRKPVNNRKVQLDGYQFDSQAEARRWQELTLWQRAGDIRDLTVHPEFVILKRCKRWGKTVRQRTYTADFQYWDISRSQWIVEDVKGGKRTKKGNLVPHVSRDFYLRFDLARALHPECSFEIVIR